MRVAAALHRQLTVAWSSSRVKFSPRHVRRPSKSTFEAQNPCHSPSNVSGVSETAIGPASRSRVLNSTGLRACRTRSFPRQNRACRPTCCGRPGGALGEARMNLTSPATYSIPLRVLLIDGADIGATIPPAQGCVGSASARQEFCAPRDVEFERLFEQGAHALPLILRRAAAHQ